MYIPSRYLTAVTTTVSGVGYMFKKDTYHILKKARSKELWPGSILYILKTTVIYEVHHHLF